MRSGFKGETNFKEEWETRGVYYRYILPGWMNSEVSI